MEQTKFWRVVSLGLFLNVKIGAIKCQFQEIKAIIGDTQGFLLTII